MGRNGLVATLACGVVATMLMPGTAQAQQDRISATEKGSLFIISKVEVRWDTTGTNVLQDTFIHLTNDFPEDVLVQMYFVNGDAPAAFGELAPGERAHTGWNWVDNEILLTQNQPTYWSALTGDPANGGLSPWTVLDPGVPPGRPAMDGSTDRVLRGFILGWAVNSNGNEIRWNHLGAGATLLNYGAAGGPAWAYGYNAWHSAIVSAVANGAESGTPGQLNLDGAEYAPAFDQLLLNFQAAGSTAYNGPRLVVNETDVTLHPVDADLRQETDGPVTTKAHYDVWNMNEVKFSGAFRCITCWDQTFLSRYGVPNHFTVQNLQTNFGKARIDGLRSFLCDVDFDPNNNADFPFPPAPGDPTDDRDIVSQDAAILGIVAELLSVDAGAGLAAAGRNMIGMGTQNALIQYDVLAPPPEANNDASGSDISVNDIKTMRRFK